MRMKMTVVVAWAVFSVGAVEASAQSRRRIQTRQGASLPPSDAIDQHHFIGRASFDAKSGTVPR